MPLIIGWVIAVGIALGIHHQRKPAPQQTVIFGYVPGIVTPYRADAK